jgi:hypothetical protein
MRREATQPRAENGSGADSVQKDDVEGESRAVNLEGVRDHP